MKVLQICHKMPYPPLDGGAQVMHYTTKGLLNKNTDLTVLAINPTRNFIDLDSLPQKYTEQTKFSCVTIDTSIRLLNVIKNIFRKESYFIERFISSEFVSKITSLLAAEKFDIIQLEHLYLCKYINILKKNSDAKIILRPQNIENIIWERYCASIRNPLKKRILKIAIERLKKYEKSVSTDLDGIMALTKEDAAWFRSFNNQIPIGLVPMGYNYENLNGYDFKKQYTIEPVVYHLGSMDWLPNVEAVKWFINNVIPELEKRQFSGKIIIAGRGMPSWVYKYNSNILEIIGEVKSPLKFQEDKQIMIVPLWSGSGIRAKIIEGLALGKTIISTSIGAQGIDYNNDKNILIADSPQAFADQIIQCVSSKALCRKIGEGARKLSLQKYHFEITAIKMLNIYDQLLSQNE